MGTVLYLIVALPTTLVDASTRVPRRLSREVLGGWTRPPVGSSRRRRIHPTVTTRASRPYQHIVVYLVSQPCPARGGVALRVELLGCVLWLWTAVTLVLDLGFYTVFTLFATHILRSSQAYRPQQCCVISSAKVGMSHGCMDDLSYSFN